MGFFFLDADYDRRHSRRMYDIGGVRPRVDITLEQPTQGMYA
jgi:hypothetical protein